MTFRASVQSSLVGLCSCIDVLNQPHGESETRRVVNEVNDSSGTRINVASQRHASHGPCRLIPSPEPRRVVSEANDFFNDVASQPCFARSLLRTWKAKYLKEPSWTLCLPNSPTNFSSRTSPNQAPFLPPYPMTTFKPPTITSSNTSPWRF